MALFEPLMVELSTQLIRIATGSLFTQEQIRGITSHAVGKYFSELFPADEAEVDAQEKVKRATEHITKAASIVRGLQTDLAGKTATLNQLIKDIEEKEKTAAQFAALANANSATVAAIRAQLEEAVRKELITQSAQGRTVRRMASAILWVVTLVLGAALGAYFPILVSWASSLF
jgi:hypothetical protein